MKLFPRLLRYLLPYKKNIALIFLFNIFYSVFSVFSLTMVAPFLSVLFGNGEMVTSKPNFDGSVASIMDTFYYYMGGIIHEHGIFAALIFIAVSMIGLIFLSNLFRYLGLYNEAPIRAGFVKNIRRDIYRKMLILPLSFYNKKKKGDILNRIGSDVQEVEWSIVCSIHMLFRDALMVIIFLFCLFSINYKLTLLSLIVLIPVSLLIAAIGKSIKRNSAEAQQILGRMSSAFDEAISGLRIIKGYNAINATYENFSRANDRFFVLNRNIFRKKELGSPLVEFLCILAMILILVLGAGFVLEESEIQTEFLIMFVVIFARAIPPAQSIVSSYYTIQKGMASADRIYQIIDAEEVIEEDKHPISKKTFDDKIEYEHVFFSYNENGKSETQVLKDVSFTIAKGENVALVGSSGSGKSTIVDLLPRFYDIQEGKILIDGIESNKLVIKDLRSLFGIVNQDVTLFNDTVFNNIAFGMEHATPQMVEAAAKAALAHDFIMEMENGYDTIIGDRGMKLSGGQRQRLSIARAFLQNPPVLILDEATSALDTESEYLVQQSIQKLMEVREQAKSAQTTIIIAHRLSTIRNADQILFIHDGRIIEHGTHDELMTKAGEYAKFCKLQNME